MEHNKIYTLFVYYFLTQGPRKRALSSALKYFQKGVRGSQVS